MPTDAEIVSGAAVPPPPVLDTASANAAMTAAADLSNLPPAGDERREELKRRADSLRKAADEMAAAAGLEAIDVSKIGADNEILGAFDPLSGMLKVSNARDTEYVYKWEQADLYGRHGNIWVTSAKALGWEVVSGNDPEAREHKQVDGTRRVGDAILMRVRKERYEALMARQRRINVARQEGIGVQLVEQAEKAGIPAHDLTNPATPAHIIQHAEAQREAARAARAAFVHASPQARPGRGPNRGDLAASLAGRKLEGMIRTGTVPGL